MRHEHSKVSTDQKLSGVSLTYLLGFKLGGIIPDSFNPGLDTGGIPVENSGVIFRQIFQLF
jgi:hypothetical protein